MIYYGSYEQVKRGVGCTGFASYSAAVLAADYRWMDPEWSGSVIAFHQRM